MKLATVAIAAVLSLRTSLLTAEADRAAKSLSTPVSRVVTLLEGLKEKLEADLKAETTLFKKYECWYKTVKDAKAASNSAATSRIDSLETYIQDIEAGKIEFTTERVDLEKQVAGLQQDLATAAALRSQERTDYAAAKVELQQALAALTEAINVLEGGTAAAASASLAQRGVHLLSARWSLRKALEFSKGMLSSDDERLLQHMVSGDVPTYDWKKLNREATFKKKYTASSGGIIKTLQSLKTTFTENLDEVEKTESAALASYNSLKQSKETMLETSQDALVALVEEYGARGLSKSEAQAEVDALQAQVESDGDFIIAVQSAYDTKKGEWTAREALRHKELTAISQAIATLHSDEARDTFKAAYSSQGYLFIQAAQESHHAVAQHRTSSGAARATDVFASLASSGDQRVALLASLAKKSAAGATGLESVIAAIDNLVNVLNDEEGDDLIKKESCESQLANATKTAQTQSRAIDGLTDDITRIDEKVSEIMMQIKEQNETIDDLNKQLEVLTRNREDEAKQFEEDATTDSSALSVIDEALLILKTLLSDMKGTSASFVAVAGAPPASQRGPAQVVQGSSAVPAHSIAAVAEKQRAGGLRLKGTAAVSHKQPYEIEAGEAPPPPPTTWEDPSYTGAEGESAGILSILELIREDVQKDIDLAQKAEIAAKEEYDKQKGDLEASVKAAEDAIASYDEEKSDLEGDKVDKESEKMLKKGELAGTMSEIESLKPGCDFVLVNYAVRVQKRQIEIDGLKKAKAILQGASFAM